jgi:toxin ParE1/3/4
MEYTVLKSVQAARDIEEAFVYIAENDLDTAVYFLVAIEESIKLIAKNPFIGSVREFQNAKLKNLRMWRVKDYENYLIFYSVEEITIKIIRFLNAKRDYNLISDL